MPPFVACDKQTALRPEFAFELILLSQLIELGVSTECLRVAGLLWKKCGLDQCNFSKYSELRNTEMKLESGANSKVHHVEKSYGSLLWFGS